MRYIRAKNGKSNEERGYGLLVFRMEDVLNNPQLHLEGANPDETLLNFDLNRSKENYEECSIGEARNERNRTRRRYEARSYKLIRDYLLLT